MKYLERRKGSERDVRTHGEGGYKAGDESGVDMLPSNPACFRVPEEVTCDVEGIMLQNRDHLLARKGGWAH